MADERDVEPARLPWLPLLPWQRDAARAALAQKASWPHALLVHGPRGIGSTRSRSASRRRCCARHPVPTASPAANAPAAAMRPRASIPT